ncbi:Fe-S-cluster-containing hydrogenase subunit [Desulfitobacterium dichloroeliminans LMG P-21439]|uniref:Fe-S-cluster-containing hydrogenase subunit n=1 Tax=Desulfitobacterium dichloroeliminans (strain LMG P-21439 / DCA1) TaxID=871963 RepID=L0F357_DESDL|nr:4Fe-4S dicluster domain-containing protein [Desulfitobacterium dichloroeliminans]AGA68284.1 Fe-S-cluster-containing hydrogenase subunit [Desulfitobacterium dichloroeliminans LMG P-21439]
MAKVGFYYDMQNCYGCKTCQVACKSEQKTAPAVSWRRVRDFDTDHPATHATLSMGCNHCENPECLKNCPTGAYTKLENGIVYQDHSQCIGCRMCTMACPYGVPQYDPEEGKVSKCSYCKERIEQGLQPACAESCPGGNIIAGDLEELKAKYKGVQELPGMPVASITNPSIIINPAKTFKK